VEKMLLIKNFFKSLWIVFKALYLDGIILIAIVLLIRYFEDMFVWSFLNA